MEEFDKKNGCPEEAFKIYLGEGDNLKEQIYLGEWFARIKLILYVYAKYANLYSKFKQIT